MFQVWSKERDGQYWSLLPYNPTTKQYCEQIIDYYVEKWGNLYHYRIEPTHVVLNQQAAWS
jgi:hypothetical protein